MLVDIGLVSLDRGFDRPTFRPLFALYFGRFRSPYKVRYPAISHALSKGANFIALAEQTGHKIPARTQDDSIFLVIARINDKYWSGVITYRDPNIRIISIRRSRTEEINLYESSRI